MVDLSILIPARNEEYLSLTLDDIFKNIRGNTEVIVVLDGCWANPPIESRPNLNIIHLGKSVGQREATNIACNLAKGKYVMKVDAHCCFDKGFDIKLIGDMQDDWTMVPVMRNLHVFDWICNRCGKKRYQGKSDVACKNCGATDFRKEIVWKPKDSPNSTSYCFDTEPHFQYFNDFPKTKEGKGVITPTMSLQGSCFVMTKEKYQELNICDAETFGSWGSQGIEVACKTWLSGGKVVCNHWTWYAHLFRTQGGDFSFPYKLSQGQVDHAKRTAKDIFFNNKWDKQVRPISWLLKKFWPIYKWTDEDLAKIVEGEKTNWTPVEQRLKKGIIYYTDNDLDINIAEQVRTNLVQISNDKKIPIVSSSLSQLKDFGLNIVNTALSKGYVAMAKQILSALQNSEADIIYFCEHDVLYHPSHFDFIPEKDDVYYYNTNVWKVRLKDSHALKVNDCKQLSGLVANKNFLIKHFEKRVAILEQKEKELSKEDFNRLVRKMGFEPGTHNRDERIDDFKAEAFNSQYPNIDIRHEKNLTPSRWSKDKFRNKKYTEGWTESTLKDLPGWSF